MVLGVAFVDVFCRRVFRSHEHERFLLSLPVLSLFVLASSSSSSSSTSSSIRRPPLDDIIINVFKASKSVCYHLCRRRQFGRARFHVDGVNDVNDVNDDETPRVVLVLSLAARSSPQTQAQKVVQRQNYVFISSQSSTIRHRISRTVQFSRKKALYIVLLTLGLSLSLSALRSCAE